MFTVISRYWVYQVSWSGVGRGIQRKYAVKIWGRPGPEWKYGKPNRIRNRVVSWTREGIEHEAAQRHADIVAIDVGIKQ